MKSFSEYIKEAYSFRLGGSQKKGFDQNKAKTLAELKKGDKFYYWNLGKEIDAYILMTDPYVYKDKFIKLQYGKEFVDGTCWIYKEDVDKEYSFDPEIKWFIATSADILINAVYDEIGEDIKNCKVVEHLNEAYNFRLGGSQKKGFNQAKMFADLEEGDKLYWCQLENDGRIKSIDNVDICKFKSLEKLKSENYKLDFSYLLNGKKFFGNTVLDKRNLDSTVNEYYNSHKSYTIMGTDLDDLLDELKNYVEVDSDVEAARKFFEEKEETNEAYNFRLGGSQQKGFNQNKIKMFDELEEDDEYFYYNK